jgi:hypothetical protein
LVGTDFSSNVYAQAPDVQGTKGTYKRRVAHHTKLDTNACLPFAGLAIIPTVVGETVPLFGTLFEERRIK